MLDLTRATRTIVAEYDLPTAYAMQCPAPDPETTDFYIAQADKAHDPEDLLIVRNMDADRVRRVSAGYMRLVGAGHGTTISVLHRDGVLGIVCDAWGKLVWIPWQKAPVVSTDPSIVRIWPGWSYAYIDHEAQTVCLRKGNLFRLHKLMMDEELGPQIGKDLGGMSSPGPGQGYCSIKVGDDYQLFTLWDYGSVKDKPTIVSGSFTTGGRLYDLSARVLPLLTYPVTQEPEGCYGLGGVFHLGMSTRGVRGKIPMSVRFDPLPDLVTMWVKPRTDAIWANSPGKLSPRAADGVTVLWDVKRSPGFQVTGEPVTIGGEPYIRVASGRLYRTRYLTSVKPK